MASLCFLAHNWLANQFYALSGTRGKVSRVPESAENCFLTRLQPSDLFCMCFSDLTSLCWSSLWKQCNMCEHEWYTILMSMWSWLCGPKMSVLWVLPPRNVFKLIFPSPLHWIDVDQLQSRDNVLGSVRPSALSWLNNLTYYLEWLNYLSLEGELILLSWWFIRIYFHYFPHLFKWFFFYQIYRKPLKIPFCQLIIVF